MLPPSFASTSPPSPARVYAVVVASVLIALLLKLLLDQFIQIDGLYIFFITAVMVSAWYGGLIPGLVATLLSAVLLVLFFTPPLFSLGFNDVRQAVWVGMFVIEGAIISGLNMLHQRAQAAWQGSNQRVATIINSISDGFFAVNRQWQLLFINEQFAQVAGRTPAELMGLSLWEVFPEAVGTMFAQQYEQAMQSGKATHFEAYYSPLATWFDVHAYPSSEGLSVFFQNITVRKEAETERVQLLAREQTARLNAEVARQRVEFLVDAGRLLASSLDYNVTLENLARLTVPALADWCVIDIVEEEGRLNRLAMAHGDPAKMPLLEELKRRYPLDETSTAPVMQVLAGGEAKLWDNIDMEQVRSHSLDSDQFDLLRQLGTQTMIAVPMVARGTMLGAITLVCGDSGRRYTQDDLTLADALARRAALAVDNARLYRNAQVSQAEASDLAGRSTFLAEVSRMLGMLLEDETALLDVAQLVADFFCDWCMIDLVQDNGYVQRIAVYANVEAEEARTQPYDARGWTMEVASLVAEVIRTGRPEFYPELPDARVATLLADIQARPPTPGVRPQSVLMVPLRARARILGALTCISARPEHRYTLADLTLAEDLANRVALAVESTRLYRELQAAVRVRDEFLSIASHELKTPLTSLLGYARLLRSLGQRYTLTEREQRGVRTIGEQADRLNKLINALLDISRIHTGRLSIEHQPMDLVTLLQRVVEESQVMLERHTITLQYPTQPVMIEGDMLRLQQVVQNLIDNAIKYSPAGGEIGVGLMPDSTWACIEVTDHGIGIPEEARTRLFQPFYRAANALPQAISGTGIGLYVVKEIVTLHGGEVDVRSEEGVGSTFIVRLPMR